MEFLIGFAAGGAATILITYVQIKGVLNAKSTKKHKEM